MSDSTIPVVFESKNQSLPSLQEMEALEKSIQIYIDSGYLPTHIKKASQALTIALKGRELGIPPLQALSQIFVVNGKPGMSAELMLALIRERCPQAVIQQVESTDKRCVLKASRPGHDPMLFEFNEEDAKKAGLIAKGGVWNSYRALMLRARCISSMSRFLFPDILGGAGYLPEELGAKLDSHGKIVDVASKAEVVNAPALELQSGPIDFDTYVIPVGTAQGKKLSEVPPDSLLRAQSFLTKNKNSIGEKEKAFLGVLDRYLYTESADKTLDEEHA